jgi:hypothetical protein
VEHLDAIVLYAVHDGKLIRIVSCLGTILLVEYFFLASQFSATSPLKEVICFNKKKFI